MQNLKNQAHLTTETELAVQEKEINFLVLLRLFVDKNVRQNSLINNEEEWRKPARTAFV